MQNFSFSLATLLMIRLTLHLWSNSRDPRYLEEHQRRASSFKGSHYDQLKSGRSNLGDIIVYNVNIKEKTKARYYVLALSLFSTYTYQLRRIGHILKSSMPKHPEGWLSSLTFSYVTMVYLPVCSIDRSSTTKGLNNQMEDQISLSDSLSSQTHWRRFVTHLCKIFSLFFHSYQNVLIKEDPTRRLIFGQSPRGIHIHLYGLQLICRRRTTLHPTPPIAKG